MHQKFKELSVFSPFYLEWSNESNKLKQKGEKASFGVNKDIKCSLLGKNISQKAEFSTAMFFNKSRFFNRESKNLVTRTTMIKHKQ